MARCIIFPPLDTNSPVLLSAHNKRSTDQQTLLETNSSNLIFIILIHIIYLLRAVVGLKDLSFLLPSPSHRWTTTELHSQSFMLVSYCSSAASNVFHISEIFHPYQREFTGPAKQQRNEVELDLVLRRQTERKKEEEKAERRTHQPQLYYFVFKCKDFSLPAARVHPAFNL